MATIFLSSLVYCMIVFVKEALKTQERLQKEIVVLDRQIDYLEKKLYY